MLEAQQQFLKIIDHTDLAKLVVAVEHDVAARRAADTPTTSPSPDHTDRDAGGRRYAGLRQFTDRTAVAKFHGERDILRAVAAEHAAAG